MANPREKNKQSESQINIEILKYFDNQIDHEQFALHLRQAVFILGKYALQDEEHGYTEAVLDINYNLNSFAEVLDPYLKVF